MDLQNRYVDRHGGWSANTLIETWIIGLGRLLIDQWLQLWKLRNDQRHYNDQDSHTKLRERILQAELEDLYTYKDKVCPNDSKLFHTTVQEHILAHPSLDTLENWIVTYRGAILASAAQASRQGLRQNRTLLDFPAFNPIARAPD